MTESRGRGRPKADNPLSYVRGVRFTEAEYALVTRAAEIAGVKPSQWIRDAVLTASQAAVDAD